MGERCTKVFWSASRPQIQSSSTPICFVCVFDGKQRSCLKINKLLTLFSKTEKHAFHINNEQNINIFFNSSEGTDKIEKRRRIYA